MWENRWAAPVAIALRKSGGQLVASGRIPVQAILAALDAAEAVQLRRRRVNARIDSRRRPHRRHRRHRHRRQQPRFAPPGESLVRSGGPPSSSSTTEAPPPPPPAAAGAQDPIAQLKKFAELRDAGILTEEEFAAEKAKILNSM